MLVYINRGNTYVIQNDESKEVTDLGIRLFDYMYNESWDFDLREIVRVAFLEGGVPTEKYLAISQTESNRYGFQNFSYKTGVIVEKGKMHIAYEVKSEQDVIFIELVTLIMNNSRINECKRCKRMFVLKNNHNSNYCERIDDVIGMSCAKVGSAEAYKEKVTKNSILQDYQTAYKRLYARVRSGRMEQAEFNAWVQDVTRIRDEMAEEFERTGDIKLVQKFKEIVGNKK